MRTLARRSAAALLVVILPSAAFAQAAITGVVKDASGAVLPGVTVEAASPVLIERVRSVASDDSGQYRSFSLHGNNSPFVSDVSVEDPLAAHRALLSELTDDLMHDVTAYLVTLQ